MNNASSPAARRLRMVLRGRSTRVRRVVGALLAAVLVAALTSTWQTASADEYSLWPQSTVPTIVTDPDARAVTLGTRFVSSVDGWVTAVRFYKSPTNVGPHEGALWTKNGSLLARVSFTAETDSGWQQAQFAQPVFLAKGQEAVVSYRAPAGQYSADPATFANGSVVRNGPLTALGSRYSYTEPFPGQVWQNASYYVDVLFSPGSGTPAHPEPTPSSSATPTSPGVTPTTTARTTAPAPSPTTGGPSTSSPAALNLPRIPWEGGPAYWAQFPNAQRGGWTDPGFFPFVIWHNGVSTDAEVAWDKAHGINTYIGMDPSTDFGLFTRNGVYWIGEALSGADPASANWVGNFLDDEVDGRYPPAEGRALLQSLVDKYRGNGKFNYANFTQSILTQDMSAGDAGAYVNNFTDAVSVDMYWLTVPFCDWSPYRDAYLVTVPQAYCRTAGSYGKTVSMLRQRDALDGKRQPIWNFVENLNGGPGEGPFVRNITPAELKGSVMSSIINEARGIVYFNQSLSGPCQGSAVLRLAQVEGGSYCGAAQAAALGDINNFVKSLAPVINTQSYDWSFGPGLSTMLKVKDGSAYIFAMLGDSQPGERTFTLPPGVGSGPVEVVGEGRTLTSSGGTFTDGFGSSSAYHVYKVALG